MEKKNRFSRPFWLVLDVKNRYLSDTNKMLKYRKHCRRDYQLVLNFIFDFEDQWPTARDIRCTRIFFFPRFDPAKRRNDRISA